MGVHVPKLYCSAGCGRKGLNSFSFGSDTFSFDPCRSASATHTAGPSKLRCVKSPSQYQQQAMLMVNPQTKN